MSYSSKSFKQKNFFILYDEKDNLICYFDNFTELKKYTKLRIQDIVKKFKKTKQFIKITIEKKEYKLYTYIDEF